MVGNKIFKNTKDIAIIAIMIAILFVQEQLLSSLPGIQLTVFLIILFSKKLGFGKTVIIVFVHVILDNLFIGSFSLMYTPTMLVGWLIIPLTIQTILKKVESPLILAISSVIYSLIYSWLYIIPNYLLLHINPIAYLASDIIFEVILAGFSFIAVITLYKPCSKVLDQLLNNEINISY